MSMLVMNYLFVRSFGVFVMEVPRKFHRVIVLRAFAGFVGISCVFNAVKYLPVATANCIIMTNPMWVAILSHFVLGETIGRLDMIGLVLAFIGVLLVNDPLNFAGRDLD